MTLFRQAWSSVCLDFLTSLVIPPYTQTLDPERRGGERRGEGRICLKIFNNPGHTVAAGGERRGREGERRGREGERRGREGERREGKGRGREGKGRLWREGVGRGGNTDVQNKEVAGILTPDRLIITTTTVSVHSGQETYYCENDMRRTIFVIE